MLGKNNATETISIKYFKKKMENSTKYSMFLEFD